MPDTPLPDLPDPASPTPANAHPATEPAAPGGSKIRSRLDPGRAARLPGTYAANYGGEDMNWRRGVGVLWTLFVLAALGELLRAATYLLAGHAGWPLPYDAVRVCIGAAVFVMLWLGWGWSRWLLVATDFLFGAWLILMVVAGQVAQHSPEAVMSGRLPGADPVVEALPKLALGVLYLFTAGYLAFSADVVDFARHRREEGRGWVTLPVAALVAGYVALVCLLPVPYAFYLGAEGFGAKQFGDETLHAMCDHWNPDALAAQGDEAFVTVWPDAARRAALGSLSPLGELKELNKSDTRADGSTVDASGTGFILLYHYDRARVDFTHGHAHFSLVLTKHPFGGWKLDNFGVFDVVFDPVPGAVPPPVATPVPATAPGITPSP